MCAYVRVSGCIVFILGLMHKGELLPRSAFVEHNSIFEHGSSKMTLLVWFLVFLLKLSATQPANDLSVKIPSNKIIVNKCCEPDEIMNFQHRCLHVNQNESQPWAPIFSDDLGKHNIQVDFKIITGFPACKTTQQWPVYHFQNSTDYLLLLPTGFLRHYPRYEERYLDDLDAQTQSPLLPNGDRRYYDYSQGSYCLDKALINLSNNVIEAQGAVVCVPEIPAPWDDTDFIFRKILDPIFHATSILCLLAVAVIYFVLPPLRDLVGNMLTTLMICLIVYEIADLVTIFTEFTNHVSFLVADVIKHMSLVAAFFWLNCFGYYIWKTFRSRNVFLRVTDGRKYCYYSTYAWCATFGMCALALTAHFLLEDDSGVPVSSHGQQTVGWLAMAMFFTPIAFTIIIDIFFYLSTGQTINRMSTYGRIHNKMKFSFGMFIKLFLIMSTMWLFMLMSWLPYEVLDYCNIVANALVAPIILVICVLSQKRVLYLLKKSCCHENCVFPCCRPDDNDPSDWGEEMMAMNSYHY